MTTDEWCTILDKAWDAGIPHVTFTGGEATLRNDLPQLIARAEKNGQVCGLLTDGLKLADKKYLDELLQTGLDHILFMLQPDNADSWKALEVIMPEDIFVTVHLTLNANNVKDGRSILERLAKLEVKSLSLTAADGSAKEAFTDLQNAAAHLGLTIKHDLPVPYSSSHPVADEIAVDEAADGAGKAWLYIEPDGDVLPTQGMADKVLGNFLRDSWNQIYK